MRHQAIFILCTFAFVAATNAAASLDQPEADAEGRLSIELPSRWVPFTADVLNVHQSHTSSGTFHRRSDGSTAWVLNTPGGVMVTMHNLRTRRTYFTTVAGDWREMAQPEPRPLQRELRLPRRHVQWTSHPILGDIYEFTSPRTGDFVGFAPALNGFRVSFRRSDGVSQEFSNFRLAEPSDDLFLPPPGGG
jgi:hypothetical protein